MLQTFHFNFTFRNIFKILAVVQRKCHGTDCLTVDFPAALGDLINHLPNLDTLKPEGGGGGFSGYFWVGCPAGTLGTLYNLY